MARARAAGASQTGRRLLATTFWSAASESLSRGLLLLAMVLVARILGREDYGQFGLIRTTINMFATLGGMGLGLTANRFVAQYRDSDKVHAGQIIGSSYLLAAVAGAVVGLALFLAAGPIATGILETPALAGGLRIAAALLLLGALNGAQIGILQGLDAYRPLAMGNLAQGITGLLGLTVGAWFFGLEGSLVGFLIYALAGVVILQWLIRLEVTRHAIPIAYTDVSAMLPILWRFSVPVMLAGVAIAPLKWLAEAVVVRRVGFADLGVFHASMTIASMLIAVISTCNAPLISAMASSERSGPSRKMAFVSLYGSWYLFLPLAIPLALVPSLASLLFGGKYAGAPFYIVNLLLLLYCGLQLYYQGVLRLVVQQGSMWFGFHTNVVEGVALIAAFFLLAQHGVAGLALAYVVSYVVRVIVSVPYLVYRKVVPAGLLFNGWFALSLLALSALVIWQVRSLS